MGCTDVREVVAAAEGAYDARAQGGLLHVALRARCLAVVDLLLDLSAHGCGLLRGAHRVLGWREPLKQVPSVPERASAHVT